MADFESVARELKARPRRWLVTGAAGFIGSHLVEQLLELGQWVRGIDNFSTGRAENVVDVVRNVGSRRAREFEFFQADVRNPDECREMMEDVEIVLHQAALGSVPRSLAEPLATHASNVTGFVNVLDAARRAGVARVVFASSSSVYGDEPSAEKSEGVIGRALSPYATSKLVDELYAEIYQRVYGIDVVGLRYFNVFGPRQDPNGPYAAVIPRWTRNLLSGQPCELYGDGGKTRDFCYVENVVQANLLAGLAPANELSDRIFNVACGETTRLDSLFEMIRDEVAAIVPEAARAGLVPLPPRMGDIASSLARIDAARAQLGYRATIGVQQGLSETVRWFASDVPCDRPSGLMAMRGADALQNTA